MIMIPFFLVALMVPGIPGGKWIALALFCLASLTDMLDGKIARKYNLITDFGKFMDPLADKLLVCSAMIALIDLDRIPAWVVIVIIAREFIISGFRLVDIGLHHVCAALTKGVAGFAVHRTLQCTLVPERIKEIIEQVLMKNSRHKHKTYLQSRRSGRV